MFYGVTSGSSDYFFFSVIARVAFVIISVISDAFYIYQIINSCTVAIGKVYSYVHFYTKCTKL
jgi:hypothetical protein